MANKHTLNINAAITANSGDFEKFLKQYRNEAETTLNGVLHKEADRIYKMAHKDFPDITGDLKQSGEIVEDDKLNVRVVWTIRYAPYPARARNAIRKAVRRRRAGIRSHALNALLKLFRSYGGN